jgi:hypothetical protein
MTLRQALLTAMMQHVGAIAAGFCQSISKVGQAVEGSLMVSLLGEPDDRVLREV